MRDTPSAEVLEKKLQIWKRFRSAKRTVKIRRYELSRYIAPMHVTHIQAASVTVSAETITLGQQKPIGGGPAGF